jgi:hypothetical protein
MPSTRALSRICLVAGFAAGLVGCGTAARPARQIQLRISAPADGTTVTSGSITVSGSVSPVGATVLVLGRSVPVDHGAFSTSVTLAPGSNLLDVLAGSPRAQAAMTAVRVYRQMLVSIPTLTSDSPTGAVRALEALGLSAHVQDNDSFLAFLIPSSPSVCGTTPAAGHRVALGTDVTVSVSKSC